MSPIGQPENERSTRPSDPEARLAATQVLLVEDDLDDAELIRLQLGECRAERFQLTVTRSLASTIELLAQKTFHVIVLDLSLPDSNGIETLTRLRAASPKTALVVMTGNPDGQISKQAAKLGADAYLMKREAEPDLLARTLHYAIERNDRLIRLESERKRSEHGATHDPLTGLPNRTLLRDRLEQAVRSSSRTDRLVGLLFVDLDDFKEVNDTHGHTRGDRVLCTAAERMQAKVRATDTVARIGGDEFVILLTQIRCPEDADAVAEKVHSALSEPLVFGGTRLSVSASIGVAVGPSERRTAEDLLAKADSAMYRAKRRRPAPRSTRSRREPRSVPRARPPRLSPALGRSDLEITYRPRVELTTASIRGVDAVVQLRRGSWAAPLQDRALLGLAENDGLGELLVTRVTDRIQADLDRSPALQQIERLGLPVAPSQLLRPTFPQQIAPLLERSRGPALELSVPASFFALDSLERTDHLRVELPPGAWISIDYEGSLDPVLAALHHVRPVSVRLRLKEVRRMRGTGLDEAFLCGLGAMLDRLQIPWQVDGVERPEQVEWLRNAGCEIVQGALFCPALSLDDLEGAIENGLAWRPEGSC